MEIKTALIIGYGEIGHAIERLDEEANIDVCKFDINKDFSIMRADNTYDIVHICFPYSSDFVEKLIEYIKNLKTKLVLIHSTIQPFCFEYKDLPNIPIIHCPIRGTHPNIYEGIKSHPLFLGIVKYSANFLKRYELETFLSEKWGVRAYVRPSYNYTALGKLLNTNWYAMQIAMANQIQRICDDFGLEFQYVYNDWMETDSINSKYEYDEKQKRAVGVGQPISRPIMVAGEIGGHCLMPNIKLSEELFSENFTKWIKEMNQYGKDMKK